LYPAEERSVNAVTFGILGRTALRVAGKIDESWGRPRERQVLGALLAHAGRRVSIETLIEWAWPEKSASLRNPVATFHTYATRIRNALRRVDVPATLVAKDGTYRLEVERSEVDYFRFRGFMTEVHTLLRQRKTPEAANLAHRALALWRGRPLEDLRTDHANNWRHRVEVDEWLPANVTLLEAMLELGDHETVLARVDDLLADHPHDLALTKVRLGALHGLARYDAAVNYYINARRRMVKEADMQGAEHIRRFHETLLADQRPPVQTAQSGGEKIAVPHQLPRDVDFVGRAEMLRALDRATKPSGEPGGGVVILDGIAGVGKTTLAVHWGHLARDRFPDGELFANINGFSESAMITQARVVDDFLIALGHQPDDSRDQRSRELLLGGLLANRQVLVILDNARNTNHVKGLISLLPTCLIIVTSRHQLTRLSATTGARRVRVEPMPATEASELLSVRLGTHQYIDNEDRVRLIRLCGGLPLAINVLAEHIATSGIGLPSAFVRQFDRRQLIVDVGEDGDGSAIAHTSFSWSYRYLTPEEQRLFRLLGLHPGPEISVELACACDGRTLAGTRRSFSALVGAHLLERPNLGDSRYRFHDLLREFAVYRVELEEPAEVRRAAERRMLDFYLRSAAAADRVLYPNRMAPPEIPVENHIEPLTFTTREQAQTWFNQERTNLAAAVKLAATRGHYDHAWRLADTVVIFFDRHGYYEDSRAILEFAVTSARAAGHRDGELSSLDALGRVDMILGLHADAQRYLNQALEYATGDGNERALATTLHHLGRLQMRRGDPTGAVDYFRRCLEVARRIGDDRVQCWTHVRIGEPLRLLDQHDQALMQLHKVEYFAQRLDDQSAMAASMATIGAVLRDRGDHQAARAYAEQALSIAERIPDRTVVVEACTTLAEISNALGDAVAAIRFGRYAVDMSHRIGNIPDQAQASEVLGNVQYSLGDLAEAIATWTHAANLHDGIGNPGRSALIRVKIANTSARVDLPGARLNLPALGGEMPAANPRGNNLGPEPGSLT
jgi:tetratricopeptide (TPR) repeat protein/DNA-binding SARP family transcriptional activator